MISILPSIWIPRCGAILLVATLASVASSSALSLQNTIEERAHSTRLAAQGSLLVVPNKALDHLLITPLSGRITNAGGHRQIALRADLPYGMSRDGRHVAGFRNAGPGPGVELLLIDAAKGASTRRITSLASDASIDLVWVSSVGSVVGVFAQKQLTIFESQDADRPDKIVFSSAASTALPSPNGELVVFTRETGKLSILAARTWTEKRGPSDALEASAGSWMIANGMRTSYPDGEGPFVFPVAPSQISADGRVLSVFLGENANTFLNFCVATGQLISSVKFDKRMNVVSALSSDGRLFAVRISPNSDDNAFQRSKSAYGTRIYESFSGTELSAIQLSSTLWSDFQKRGSVVFVDQQPERLSFQHGDTALAHLNSRKMRVQVEPVPTRRARSQKAISVDMACKPVPIN